MQTQAHISALAYIYTYIYVCMYVCKCAHMQTQARKSALGP